MENYADPVYNLEELAGNAWPAEVVQLVDGWRFRYTPGVTSRRVNSVWPNNPGRFLTIDQKLAEVEAFYARRSMPARFQISPAAKPADLDAILAQRGYQLDAPTIVQTAGITSISDSLNPDPGTAVQLEEALPDDWLAFQREQYGLSPDQVAARRMAFNRIGPRAVFARVQIGGKTAGIGLGIVERGWLGIFAMMTLPEIRRRGVATAVLYSLAKWGQANGAGQAYLQVMENNDQARPLYERAGFSSLYQYHYRQST